MMQWGDKSFIGYASRDKREHRIALQRTWTILPIHVLGAEVVTVQERQIYHRNASSCQYGIVSVVSQYPHFHATPLC
jgi:hypothetical protein